MLFLGKILGNGFDKKPKSKHILIGGIFLSVIITGLVFALLTFESALVPICYKLDKNTIEVALCFA